MSDVLGVVAALETERRWIRSQGTRVEVSGVGAARAGDAAQKLIDRGATALVSCGAAGGLDPEIGPGTVILPDTVIAADGSHMGVDLGWRDRLLARIEDRVRVATSKLLETARPVTTVAEKRDLYRRTGAAAVDMESAAIAAVANRNRIPWIVVRVVVDGAMTALPAAVLKVCDEEGRLKRSWLIRLVLRPREWSALIELARGNTTAGRSMRAVWSVAGPDLGLS